MEHLALLKQLPLFFSTDRLMALRNTSLILSFIINGLMILSYKRVLVDGTEYSKSVVDTFIEDSFPVTILIQAFGYVLLATSFFMFVFYIFINGPLILRAQWSEKCRLGRVQKDLLDLDIDKYDKIESNPSHLPSSITA